MRRAAREWPRASMIASSKSPFDSTLHAHEIGADHGARRTRGTRRFFSTGQDQHRSDRHSDHPDPEADVRDRAVTFGGIELALLRRRTRLILTIFVQFVRFRERHRAENPAYGEPCRTDPESNVCRYA